MFVAFLPRALQTPKPNLPTNNHASTLRFPGISTRLLNLHLSIPTPPPPPPVAQSPDLENLFSNLHIGSENTVEKEEAATMAEPPYKRARRPDSKQMWEESDRRAPVQSRERDDRRDGHDRGGRDDRRDRDRERDRRYRSRSPRGRDDRNRGGRREERGDRGGGRGRDDREEKGGRRRDDGGRGGRDRDRERERDGGRNSKHERSRSRDRRRSRSPRRERERDADIRKDTEQDKPKVLKPAEEEFTKSRTATPPVSFRVGRATSYEAPDHEKMDTDDDAKPLKIKGAKSKKVVEEPEEDEEIVVEDDGMAAMQAMMGFGGFGTTHQKKVAGNEVYAVRKEKKTEYRQYMNRVGGFNRPLSPSHES